MKPQELRIEYLKLLPDIVTKSRTDKVIDLALPFEKLEDNHQNAWKAVIENVLYSKDLTGEIAWNSYVIWVGAEKYASHWDQLSVNFKEYWKQLSKIILS